MKLAKYGEFFKFIENGPFSEKLSRYFYFQIYESKFIIIIIFK
jgi:hypothetical protein